MTNPASTRRVPASDPQPRPRVKSRRLRMARALPVGAALAACLLLAVAAAADAQVTALVLALWVGVLAVVGLRVSRPAASPAPAATGIVRRPVLVLAELRRDGQLGATCTLPVVASPEAIAVLDSRPRG